MIRLSWVLATLGGGRQCSAFCPGLAGSVALTSAPLSPPPKSPTHVHDRPLSRSRRPPHLPNDMQGRCSLDGVSSSRGKSERRIRGRSCRAPSAAAGREDINAVNGQDPTPPDQPPDAIATDNAEQAAPMPPNVVTARRRNSKQGSMGGVGVQTPLGPTVALGDVDAERMYTVARSLHLRRHRSCASRGAALHLFRETLRLRPGWIETDSRFATDSGIDEVFRAFSCVHGCPDSAGSDSSSSFHEGTEATQARDTADAVACLRATLAGVGYTASRVQEKFYAAVGPVHGQRLPGPYYLRKSFDHTHAATVASLGPPREALDVAIRLFLLGLALPQADVERSLGTKAIESARHLGILGECPVDSSVAVSLVQLFPLDAEALSSSAYLPGERGSPRKESFGEPRRKQDRVLADAAAAGGGKEGVSTPTRSVGGAVSVASPSDMIFATDWPPPGSTALTEEPVMYIGPDSIGLVQHAPRSPPHPTTADRAEVFTERPDGQEARSAPPKEKSSREEAETILDLCCGSGIQGIAAAVLRGGNARVTCVDINPRAVRFARFNALLNGLDETRFSAIIGDLYSTLSTAPPGNADSSHAARADVRAPTPTEKECTASGSVERHGAAVARSLGDSGDSHNGGRVEADEGPGEPSPAGSPPSSDDPRQARPGDDLDFDNGRSPLCRADDDLAFFDLILANPPFVPVPPKLGSAKRRYDVFASGGANGEDVVEGIFRGATAHLHPGGVLAVVSELVNPRTFDAKLGRWVGAVRLGSRSVAVDVQVKGGTIAEHLRHVGTDRATTSELSGVSGALNDGAVDWEMCAWNGVVLHEKEPWTARQYAARRSGSAREAEGWERHLQLMGIEEMAPGFVFVRRLQASVAQRVGNSSDAEPHGAVEIQGVEKLWAPHNAAAVENTEIALRRMQEE